MFPEGFVCLLFSNLSEHFKEISPMGSGRSDQIFGVI